MNPTDNGVREESEKNAPVNAGETPQVGELAGRLMRLLDTLKETPGKRGGIPNGDGKLAADFLEMAENLYESLEALRERPQEEGSLNPREEDLPVLNSPPAVSEIKPEKEEPSDSPEEAAAPEPSDGNAPDYTASVVQTAEPSDGSLFTGEMKLIVVPPANLGTVLKLYNYLQTLPDIKLVYTIGARDADIAIKIAVDKPTPILNLISKIGGVILAAEDTLSQAPEEKTVSLLDKKKGDVKEVRLICRE